MTSFMVGNTYPYTPHDWIADIQLAQANGFDAFALNVGCEDWQKERVGDCYAAAHQLHTDFKLFLSFDMTSIPGETDADVEFLRQYMELFGRHPNQFLYKGGALVSTFAGDWCTFGQPSLHEAWGFARSTLESVCPIHLVPAFFIDPARYPLLTSVDGIFHWNGGWPIHLTTDSSRKEVECPTLDTDHHHLRHLYGRTYMAAVSPWFFTHYGPDSWNKNWTYRGDDWLLVRRWEHLLAHRNGIDIVQVISWNDYGESHYLAPVRGAQPNSQAWVDGFPHTPWLVLNAYFAHAFKEGRMPPIEQDRLFVWARPHPKSATAPDTVPRPRGWELTDDRFWVIVMAHSPCSVVLDTGDERPHRYSCSRGVSKLSCPLRAGYGMRAELMRDGVVVLRCHPCEYQFQAEPEVYNFNAFVASCG
ncbi:glycoside hydrolase family 71 protein [Multifurca ochricompacta]|uniref:Glycoside hydrolase family 71 protein n=1 Tax=Multifurca ochricompacta TaxID=376703 RepID=A0AAD4M3U7_9AGAM|nr:glycoside hydrolase family 71 protein [Multifurca ochricompacta]